MRAFVLALALASCAQPPPAASPTAKTAATEKEKPKPGFRVTIAPRPPVVHVEIHADAAPVTTLKLARGKPTNLVVHDASPIAATMTEKDGGTVVTLARPSSGAIDIAYDIAGTTDARAPTHAVVVADDRFRALGESIILVPEELAEKPTTVTIVTDGTAIRAPNAASSLGNGTLVEREASPRALVRSAFLSGSLGTASFSDVDTDRAAWLGYTAFDPRPAVAEIAQIRTALRERWKGAGEEAFQLMFVSTPRPTGSYAMLPRATSLLVHLGPSEPWSAPLRVNIAQHLVHAWLGGELRLSGSESETVWFHEGFARYLAAHTLVELGLLRPDEQLAYVLGLLSVQATSKFHGQTNAALASNPAPEAHALLMARGALYAQALAFRMGKPFEATLFLPLLETSRSVNDTKGVVLQPSTFSELLGKHVGPNEPKELNAMLDGKDVVLPSLGSCYRARTGDYTTFDLGFDLAATLDRDDRTLASRTQTALLDGDVLEEARFDSYNPDSKAQITVTRNGEKKTVEYFPRGPKRRGQIFDRNREIPDPKCAPAL